jgi:hypothetical protein
MSQYWLHVNNPTNKARIHAANGCAWVRKTVRRIQSGVPYGPIHGDRNGYWAPYASTEEVEAAQARTGKTRRDHCGSCWR